jgi:microcystin-dependent protein
MSSPFVGQLQAMALNFAPRGWAFCNGQTLPISQNTALFSLVGTFYGGNGTSNFQLPDLQSRVPLKYGTDVSGNQYFIGEPAGEESIALLTTEMPSHSHTFFGTADTAPTYSAPIAGAALGTSTKAAFYSSDTGGLLSINPSTVSVYAGQGLAHTNLQPYLAITWCIALQGIYPARN